MNSTQVLKNRWHQIHRRTLIPLKFDFVFHIFKMFSIVFKKARFRFNKPHQILWLLYKQMDSTIMIIIIYIDKGPRHENVLKFLIKKMVPPRPIKKIKLIQIFLPDFPVFIKLKA